MNPNGNVENLIPMDVRSEDEQRKLASKGGKASGESRRKRAALREELDSLLSHKGVQKKVCLALVAKALEGDVRAFEVIRDTVDGKPVKCLDWAVSESNKADQGITFQVVDETGTVTSENFISWFE